MQAGKPFWEWLKLALLPSAVFVMFDEELALPPRLLGPVARAVGVVKTKYVMSLLLLYAVKDLSFLLLNQLLRWAEHPERGLYMNELVVGNPTPHHRLP